MIQGSLTTEVLTETHLSKSGFYCGNLAVWHLISNTVWGFTFKWSEEIRLCLQCMWTQNEMWAIYQWAVLNPLSSSTYLSPFFPWLRLITFYRLLLSLPALMWLSSDSTSFAGWIQLSRDTAGTTESPPHTSTHPLSCNTHAAPSMRPCPSWTEGRAVNGDIYLDDIPISTLGAHTPWTPHCPRPHMKHCCVYVQFSLRGLTQILFSVKRRRGRNEQIKTEQIHSARNS